MLRSLKRARPIGTLWRHGDFLKLWTGQTISNFGTEITELAIPLVAILTLDASAFEVAALGTVAFAPFILFTLPAGVWVDRLPRRGVLIVGDLGRAVLLASIPVAWALDALTLAQLYVVGFLVGILTVFFDVAYQAYLPSLVGRDQLVEGNSKLEITRSGASIAGPGVAGILISAITAPYAIVVDALSYVLSGGFLVRIRKRETPTEPASEESRPRLRTELREGLAYVLKHPYLRPQAICTGSSNFCTNLAFSILLVYAVRELGMSAAAIGIVLALSNVGWLAGAAAAGPIGRVLGVGRATLAATFLFGPSMLLVPLAPQSFPEPFLVTAFALGGFGSVVYNIQQVSLRQAITPERMQGRMNSVMRFLVWGTIPLGALAGGALGSTIGLRETLFVGAALGSATFLPILLSPIRSLERIPEPEEPVLPTLAADEGVVMGAAPASVSPDA
jgi:MFS family permease